MKIYIPDNMKSEDMVNFTAVKIQSIQSENDRENYLELTTKSQMCVERT